MARRCVPSGTMLDTADLSYTSSLIICILVRKKSVECNANSYLPNSNYEYGMKMHIVTRDYGEIIHTRIFAMWSMV